MIVLFHHKNNPNVILIVNESELFSYCIEVSLYLQKEFERQAVEKYCNSDYRLGKLDGNGQRVDIAVVFERNGKTITQVG